ncbi:hypothetical protein [Motilimonas eburnea]|uniref:hypothetical protein n=1 Tax=Motilimonas eburnea TaxID=1737488 RepID=UPI001E2F8E4A|nr:hypothetical protein [Motilimonas eburnea]MCE2573745.1 hypothetical protein [Motilimonas eburnea]
MKDSEKFGKLISQELRDKALNRYLDLESGRLKSPSMRELMSKLSGFSSDQKELVRKLLTECIDTGIHDFLFALEEENEEIKVTINGHDIAKESDGLSGEIYTDDGWFEKYSEYGQSGI